MVQQTCQAELATDVDGETDTDWIEFYLYSLGNRRLRPRGRYLLILPGGLTKAGVTDSNGFAREAPVAAGQYQLHAPSSSRRAQAHR